MQLSSKTKLNLRHIILFGLGLILMCGAYLSLGQEFSWAAPNQNPNQQTVPPRPPAPPNPDPDSPSKDENNNDNNDDVPLPPPPTPTFEPEQEIIEPTDEPEPAAPLPSPMVEPEPVDLPQKQIIGENNDVLSNKHQELEDEGFGKTNELEASEATSDLQDEQSGALLTPQEADLSLNVLPANHLNLIINKEVEFAITVYNDGPDNATNVSIAKLLPPGLELSSVDASIGVFNETSGMWTISAIAPGQSGTLTFVVKASDPEQITNISEITAVDQFDPDSTPANNVNGEDDQISIFVKTTAEVEVKPVAAELNQSTKSDFASDSVVETSLDNDFASLTWLYALLLGLLLILGGVFLTRRSQA